MKRWLAILVALILLAPAAKAKADAFFDEGSGRWTIDGESLWYGVAGDVPLFCDWNGDSSVTVGVYRHPGRVLIRNSNRTGVAEVDYFFGLPGDVPICGDWNGDGVDTMGVFRPARGEVYLRNEHSTGFAEVEVTLGSSGGQPFAGDWAGSGVDSVGIYDPETGRIAVMTGGDSPLQEYNGEPNRRVVVGDWDGDGRDGLGFYEQGSRSLVVWERLGDSVATVYEIDPEGGVPVGGEPVRSLIRPASEPVPASEPAPEAEPVPASEPVPAAEPAPEPEPVPAVEPAPEAEAAPEAEPAPAVESAPTPSVSGQFVYGNPIQASGLANNTLKGGVEVANRITVPRDGDIVALRKWIKFDARREGYHAGNGGTVVVELRADDGTAAHLPSNVVLGKTDPFPGIQDINDHTTAHALRELQAPVSVKQGDIIHIVARNVDPDPTTNWVSTNDLFHHAKPTPRQNAMPDSEFAVLRKRSTGWEQRPGFTAMFEFHYASGYVYGQGYVNVLKRDAFEVSGDRMVRQRFTVSGGDRTVNTLWFRTLHTAGNGGLTGTVSNGQGTELMSVTIPAGETPLGGLGSEYATAAIDSMWARIPLPEPLTLRDGQSYFVTFSAPSGTTHEVVALQDGSFRYGYSGTSTFTDGYAESNDGSGWSRWLKRGEPSSWADLSFYFSR